jgi:hypothetical protein
MDDALLLRGTSKVRKQEYCENPFDPIIGLHFFPSATTFLVAQIARKSSNGCVRRVYDRCDSLVVKACHFQQASPFGDALVGSHLYG